MFHSIQIKKQKGICVCVCVLNVAQGRRLSVTVRLPITGLRGRRFVRLQETSGIETSPAPRFYVWAHMFLSNASPPHYYLQFTADEGALQLRLEQGGRKG